jgi:hypothetical protein
MFWGWPMMCHPFFLSILLNWMICPNHFIYLRHKFNKAMGAHFDDHNLSPEEQLFREYITRGDDFCKIELFRQAVNWYRKAVEMKPDDPEAQERLKGCSSKIKGESRIILIILGVAAAITIIVLLVS